MPGNGTKNLTPIPQRSKEEQREIQVRGGKASGEARRRIRTFKDVVSKLLDRKISDETIDALQGIIQRENEGEAITADEAIVLAQIAKAIKGDTAAAAFVRDTAGEKPTDKLEASVDGLVIRVDLTE